MKASNAQRTCPYRTLNRIGTEGEEKAGVRGGAYGAACGSHAANRCAFPPLLWRESPLRQQTRARDSSHFPRIEQGFTIIELVVVIVLLGILATFAVPRFFSKQPFSARGYSDELVSALRYAQKVAVASGCDVAMSIDTSGYSAAQRPLSGSICASSGTWSVPVRKGDGTALSGTAPNDAMISAPVMVVFASNGQLSGGAPTPITVGPHTISVDAMTGAVRVQ